MIWKKIGLFFNSTMDILDMVISKVDPEISKVYEE